MTVGNVDGLLRRRAVERRRGRSQGIGFTHLATQDLWQHHPEKALVVNATASPSERTDVARRT